MRILPLNLVDVCEFHSKGTLLTMWTQVQTYVYILWSTCNWYGPLPNPTQNWIWTTCLNDEYGRHKLLRDTHTCYNGEKKHQKIDLKTVHSIVTSVNSDTQWGNKFNLKDLTLILQVLTNPCNRSTLNYITLQSNF